MKRLSLWVFLAGCDATGSLDVTTDDPDATDDGEDVVPTCQNPVVQWLPTDGAEEVDYHTRIAGELTEADETAVATLLLDGEPVAGGSRIDDKRVIFSPDIPLEGGVTYTLEIEHACGTASASFTTAKFNWSLDLRSGVIESPSALDLLRDQLVPVYFGVESRVGQRWNFLGVVGDDTGQQDLCNETIALPEARFTDPDFQIGPGDWMITVSGFDVQIRDYQLTGTFSEDWETMDEVNLTGRLDLRDLEGLVDGFTPQTLCSLIALSGDPCEECGSPSGRFCVDIDIRDIEGARQTWSVVPRSPQQVANDPTCAN